MKFLEPHNLFSFSFRQTFSAAFALKILTQYAFRKTILMRTHSHYVTVNDDGWLATKQKELPDC